MDFRRRQCQRREPLAAGDDAKFRRLLDRINGVGSGVGEADNLRLGALGLQQEGREVGGVERVEHVAEHLAPAGHNDVAGVFLQRVAESVVHGYEEPGIGACLHQRAARRDRDRVRVTTPMEAVGRAGRVRERRCRRAHHDVDLLPVGGDLLHGKRDRRRREVGDHVDAFGVVPAAGDVAGEIWLVLVIGGHQLDLLAEHAAAEILNRHFRGFDRPLAAIVGIDPGLIVENADLHAFRGRLRHQQASRRNGGHYQ